MPRNEYAGKRLTLTMPHDIYAALETWGKKDMRNLSQAALFLIQEGLKARGLIKDDEETKGS